MFRLLAFGLLVTVWGCTGAQQSPQQVEDQSSDDSVTAKMQADVRSPSADENVDAYPEKADVVRLLSRASELISDGRFEDALAITNEAITMDPDSPTANEMREKLVALVLRIDRSPSSDDRRDGNRVAVQDHHGLLAE